MPRIDTWAAVDDAVLGVFRDGRARTPSDVFRALPDLTRREIRTALEVNVQAAHLAMGELSYQITDVGRRHLGAVKVA